MFTDKQKDKVKRFLESSEWEKLIEGFECQQFDDFVNSRPTEEENRQCIYNKIAGARAFVDFIKWQIKHREGK